MNEKLTNELAKAYRKIDALREKIIDPFYRLKKKGTNEYMIEKPKVKKPPNVLVTAEEVIKVESLLKKGTCFVPKLDEDEVFGEYQKDKSEAERLQKEKAVILARSRKMEEEM